MPYKAKDEVPDHLKDMTLQQANYWSKIYDNVKKQNKSEKAAAKIAWNAFKRKYKKKGDKWVKKNERQEEPTGLENLQAVVEIINETTVPTVIKQVMQEVDKLKEEEVLEVTRGDHVVQVHALKEDWVLMLFDDHRDKWVDTIWAKDRKDLQEALVECYRNSQGRLQAPNRWGRVRSDVNAQILREEKYAKSPDNPFNL